MLKKLTPVQRKILKRMNNREWYTAKELNAKQKTIDSLMRKKRIIQQETFPGMEDLRTYSKKINSQITSSKIE